MSEPKDNAPSSEPPSEKSPSAATDSPAASAPEVKLREPRPLDLEAIAKAFGRARDEYAMPADPNDPFRGAGHYPLWDL